MFKEHIKPIVVLVVICLVATVALSATHMVAQPTIDANQAKSDNEARQEVLPDGDEFVESDVKLVDGVTSCYEAKNGAGYAIQAGYKGFGGTVTSIIGVDSDGNITGIKVTDYSNETPGLGTKAAEPDYLKQYLDTTGECAGHIRDNQEGISAISGATITSNAVYGDVVEAMNQYKECGGGK